MTPTLAASVSVEPMTVILAIGSIVLIIVLAAIIWGKLRPDDDSKAYHPRPADPSMEGLHPDEEDETPLTLKKEDEEKEELPIFTMPEKVKRKDLEFEETETITEQEDEEMSEKTIFDEVTLIKLKGGEMLEFVRMYPDKLIALTGDGTPVKVEIKDVEQFIGSDNKLSMLRIRGDNELWLLENMAGFQLCNFENEIAAAKKAENLSGVVRQALKKDMKLINEKDEEIASFMCYDGSTLLVRFAGSGKYAPLKIDEPLKAGSIVILSAEGTNLSIFIDQVNNKMEVYDGDYIIAAS